mmetsp:Transcript_17196/g.24447  ORF Transcript_17196/g.24447 Transcript_17196/m.24447 type:complete len:355 (-) Transcript_17196:31-1095(-)
MTFPRQHEKYKKRRTHIFQLIASKRFIMCSALLLLLAPNLLKSVTPPSFSTTSTITAKENRDETNSDYQLAYKESLGFFDDIPSSHWKLMRTKVEEMSPNFNTFYLPHSKSQAEEDDRLRGMNHIPGYFYQNHYEPEFSCWHERRIGALGDGGKWICDPHRIANSKDCLVYSVGSDGDFSFEEDVLKKIGEHCEIHTFDFGNYGQKAAELGSRTDANGKELPAVNYHQYGLGAKDDPPEFKSLSTIVQELGHQDRIIEIFKIDCEGCEWTTAHSWFDAPVTLRQIQVELHNSTVTDTPKFFDMIYDNGYVIFAKEINIANTGPDNTAIEYAMLKLSPLFHQGYTRERGYIAEDA